MPPSSRALYYQLGVEADDDGFIDPYSVMLTTKSSTDDMKVLIIKGFVIEFESGVMVIRHWKQNNMIRKDTYTETQYINEKKQLKEGINNVYEMTHSTVNVPLPQYSIGKVREDKIISKDKSLREAPNNEKKVNSFIELFKPLNLSYEVLFRNKTERAASFRMIEKHSFEKMEKIISLYTKLKDSELGYIPAIYKPTQLESKLSQLVDALKRNKKLLVETKNDS